MGVKNLYTRHCPAGLCRRSGHGQLGVQREHGGRLGADLAGNFSGRDEDRYVESAAGSAVFHVLTWKAGEGTSATAAVTPTLNGACTGNQFVPQVSRPSLLARRQPWLPLGGLLRPTRLLWAATTATFTASVASSIVRSTPSPQWTGRFTLPVAGTGGASAHPERSGLRLSRRALDRGGPTRRALDDQCQRSYAQPVCRTGDDRGRRLHHCQPTRTHCHRSGLHRQWRIIRYPGFRHSGQLGAARVFAFSGNDGTNGASAVVAQLNEDLTRTGARPRGPGQPRHHHCQLGIFTPALSTTPTSAPRPAMAISSCAAPPRTAGSRLTTGSDSTAYPTMNATPDGSLLRLAVNNLACAPYTELFNPNITLSGGADRSRSADQRR